jgi:hypothetical protein
MTPSPHDYELQKHKKNVLHSERRIAEEAILDGQVVKVGTLHYQVKVAGANEQALGVALNSVTAADIAAYEAGTGSLASIEVEIAMIGVVPVMAYEDIDADAFVIPAALGTIAEALTGATDNVIGKLLRDATAGEETHILIVYIPPAGRTQA